MVYFASKGGYLWSEHGGQVIPVSALFFLGALNLHTVPLTVVGGGSPSIFKDGCVVPGHLLAVLHVWIFKGGLLRMSRVKGLVYSFFV